jgi:hypothetical protein
MIYDLCCDRVNSFRNISVFNANRVKVVNGQLNTILAYAIQDPKVNASLSVHFFDSAEGAPCLSLIFKRKRPKIDKWIGKWIDGCLDKKIDRYI